MPASQSSSLRFVRNTIVLLASQVVLRVTGIVSAVLLANYLDVELFGRFNFALAFAGLFIPLSDFGVDTLIVREISSGRIDRTLAAGTAILLKACFAGLTFVVLLAAARLMFPEYDDPNLLYMGGVIILVRTLPGTLIALFRADQRMSLDTRVQVWGKAAEFALVVASVLLQVSLFTLMALLIAGGVANAVYAMFLARRAGYLANLSYSIAAARNLVRGGLPFVLTGVSVVIYFHIDTVMLSRIVGDVETGIYRAAANLIFAVSAFSAAVVTALFPLISSEFEKNRETALRAARMAIFYSLLFSLPVAAGTILIASDLMSSLFKGSFIGSAPVLQILIWWIPLSYVTNILGHILAAIGHQKSVLAVAIINAVFNVATNAFLIPTLKSEGAALTTVATELLGLIILTSLVRKRFGSVIDLTSVAHQAVACLPMMLTVFLIGPHVNVFLTVPMGIFVFVITAFAFRVVTVEDARKFMRALLIQQTPSPKGTP